MPINVKGLFETLQYKANNIDSSTSTSEILDTLKAIKLADGNTIISYDSDGALPDAATSNIKLAYVKSTGIIKFNNGTWDTLTGSLDGVSAAVAYSFQGSVSGYNSGGNGPSPSDNVNVIQKFSFATDGNATDVGDLTVARREASGQSSTTNGYTSEGLSLSPNIIHNIIDKFPFASDGNATDVGDVTLTRYASTGQSSSVSGYTSGGRSSTSTGFQENVIDKFPFSVDANATDVGDLTVARYSPAGQSSTTHGYSSGGLAPPAYSNVIDKFSFSSDDNATDVGDLPIIGAYGAGQSSTENGYVSGGFSPAVAGLWHTNIYKFSFATDGNATDIADITELKMKSAGQSSTSSGYVSGGQLPSTPFSNVIEKFPFATDANATDVGDLITFMVSPTGQQV